VSRVRSPVTVVPARHREAIVRLTTLVLAVATREEGAWHSVMLRLSQARSITTNDDC
jgi:hypothetical protein